MLGGTARDGRTRSPGPDKTGTQISWGHRVLSHPDPILMRVDIAQVASEHPDLDPAIVDRIYQHLVVVQSRQPTADEFREYVARLTASVDEPTLRGLLGLGAPSGTRSPAQAAPRRGRPKGSRSVTREQIVEAYRALRASCGRAPTQAELAANLRPRIATRTLLEHLADYGLPWSPV